MQCYITIKSNDEENTLFDALTSSAKNCAAWGRDVSVNSIEIIKELYCPNQVQVQLQLASTGSALSMSKLKEDLLNAKLSVFSVPGTLTTENMRTYIVRNYLICKVVPMFGKSICIDLTAYSPDVQLTFDKFCATWVGKKFAQDVVPSTLKSTFSSTLLDLSLDTASMHHLTYSEKKKELIQPYLVQYNESFYDLMRRVAYRCGEFLYWENEKLHVGLDSTAQASAPIQYDKCVGEFSFQPTKSVTAVHRDIFESEDTTESDGLGYFSSDSSQDYYDQVKEYNKTKYDVWKPKAKITGYVSDTLKESTLTDMVLSVSKTILNDVLEASDKNEESKEKFNKKWCFDEDGASTRQNKSDQYAQNSNSQQTYNLYSTAASGSIPALNVDFYQQIQAGIQAITETRMTVDVNTSTYQHIGLGDVVQLQDMGGSFIVTRIYRKEQVEGGENITYQIQVVTLDEDNLFPPVQSEGNKFDLTCQAGSQTAFVEDNSDPLGMGRVRVRYPWQQGSEDASPWIRMSSQMASSSSGFNFLPQEGDEVLINFVGGNVEAPYVAGCLYSASHKPAGSSAITSLNGHSITFKDPQEGSGWMAVNEFAPILGFISDKLAEDKKDEIEKKKKEVKNALAQVKPNSVVSDSAPVSANSPNGMKNALFLKQKLDLARKFYQDANAKPAAMNKVVPSSLMQTVQYQKQLAKEQADAETWEMRKKTILENPQQTAGQYPLEKILNYMASVKTLLDQGTMQDAQKEQTQNEYNILQDFYKNTLAQPVTWAELGIDHPVNYTKNAQYYMHWKELRYKLRSGLRHDMMLADSDWSKLQDSDWTNPQKVYIDSTQKPIMDMEGLYGMTIDQIQHALVLEANAAMDSATDERWFFPQLTGYSGANNMERLAQKIKTLEEKLRAVKMPSKPEDTTDESYKNYLTKEAELKALKKEADKEPFSADEYRAGGITMTDTLGLYKISMDAGKRNISISSPVGDVKINAFTGISILAPTGDVTIKGKNITLEAGNNVKIISGKNKNSATSAKDFLKSLGTEAVSWGEEKLESMIEDKTGWNGNIVNLKTLRVVLECLISPVEGTLQIHSGNNLILESNNAKANLPVGNMNLSGNKTQLSRSRIKALNAAADMVVNQESVIKRYTKPLDGATDELIQLLGKKIGKINGADISCVQLFGHKFCGKADYTSSTTDDFVKALFDKLTDGKKLKSQDEFTKEDLVNDEIPKNDRTAKFYMNAVLSEMNQIKDTLSTYHDNVKKLDDTLKSVMDVKGATDVSSALLPLFKMKEDDGTFIVLDANALKPIASVATLHSQPDLRRAALKAIVQATVSVDYPTRLEDMGVAALKMLQSMLGSDKKAVAEYFNPDAPTETLATALATVQTSGAAVTTQDDWSKIVDNLDEPSSNEFVDLLKDTVTTFVANETGLSGVVKDAQGIMDDIGGLTAEKSGKLLVAVKGDQTMEIKSDGQISTPVASAASLKNLKKKLSTGWT